MNDHFDPILPVDRSRVISLSDLRFEAKARNRLAETSDPGTAGLVAALESVYYALNQRDTEGCIPVGVSIRTSRYFRHDSERGRWLQFHHHSRIDDPIELAAHQEAQL